MSDIADVEDVSTGLSVEGGDINRAGSQPGSWNRQSTESMESNEPSMPQSYSDASSRTITIEGVPDTYVESLSDLLVNRKKGGGRMDSFGRDPLNPKNMVAVFAHSTAAKHMLSLGSVTVAGFSMKISSPTSMQLISPTGNQSSFNLLRGIGPVSRSISNSLDSEFASMGLTSMSDISARTIVVRGVRDQYRSVVKDYLANPENGGCRLISFEQDRMDPRNIIAVFAHQKAAENMLHKGTITIIGMIMKIGRPGSNSESSFKDDQGMASDTIKVYNIPQKAKEDMLKLYFEIKRRSGGGPIKALEMKPNKQKARIQFESADDAAEVARRQAHNIADGFMDVVLLEARPATGSGSCRAIRVSGIDQYKLDRDHISLYFEKASDDDITDLFLDQDVAVITFTTPEAVQRVLSKKKHVVSNTRLRVEAMSPSSPPPVYSRETEKRRLIVKHLPFGITMAKLSKFLEPEAGCGVTGWLLGPKKSSAMLEFGGEPDYAALQGLVTSVPFCGRMLRIQRVPVTIWAKVEGLSDKIYDESVVRYFAEKANTTRDTTQLNSVVLRFPQHSALSSVLSQRHVLSDHSLTLSPFSKELGCVLPATLPKDPLDNWIPRSTEVPGGQERLEYIQGNLQIRDRIEQTIAEVNCRVVWPTEVERPVILEQIARGSEAEDQEWKVLCSGAFSSVLDDIVTRKLVAKPHVLGRLKTRVERENAEVGVKLDVESSEIHFTGFRDSVATFEKMLVGLKDEVEREIEEEEERKRRKVEVLSTLKPPQIRYIRDCGVEDEIRKRFAKLNLKVDEQEVRLEAVEELLTDAKLFIYDIINQIEPKFVDLTQDLTQLITSEPTKTFINDYFKHMKIKAVIEELQPGRNGVYVHAIGQEEIQKASTFLTKEFLTKEIEINDAARHAIQSLDWNKFVEGLTQRHRFFRLRTGEDVLFISSKENLVEGILREIQDVFKKHLAVEHFVSMKFANAQLVETFRKSDIETLKGKLMESATGGKLNSVLTPGDTSGFALKGSHEEVEAAKKCLETLAKSATEEKQEVLRPGVVSLVRKPKWKEFEATVQKKHAVILRTTVTNPYNAPSSSDVNAGPTHKMVVNGHDIVVVLGDITDVEMGGALINPADPRLELTRGLGLEIVRLGGQIIQEQCTNHVKHHGDVSPGKVFVSKAGNMLCEIIIHVVEPKTFDNHDHAVTLYLSAVREALEKALEEGVVFVAFPLSFGAAFKRELLFATIKEFFEKPGSARLKSVKFVDDDVEQLKKLEQQLKDYEFSLTAATAVPGSPPASAQLPLTPTSGTELSYPTPEGIIVKFYKGTICAVKVDVIVNSTAKTLVLGQGGVSKAILSGAGPEIQAECQQKAPNGLSQYGDILVTKAYKLSCKAIYHGAAIQWDNGAGPAEKVLRTFVSNALIQAHKQSMTSIAIPAIGSGTLKFPHDIVVKVLLDEIAKFSKTHLGTPLQTIYTVAYEQNLPSVAAFEKAFLSLQSMNKPDFKGVTLRDGCQSLVDYDATSSEDEPDQCETETNSTFDVASGHSFHERTLNHAFTFTSSDDNYDSGEEHFPPPDSGAEEETSIGIDFNGKHSKKPDALTTPRIIKKRPTNKRKTVRLFDMEDDDMVYSETGVVEGNVEEKLSRKTDDLATSKTIQDRQTKKRTTMGVYDFEDGHVPSSEADVEEESVDEKSSLKSNNPMTYRTNRDILSREAKNTKKRPYNFEEDDTSSSEAGVEEESTDEECQKKQAEMISSKESQVGQTKKVARRIYDSEDDYVPSSESSDDTEKESDNEKHSKKPNGKKITFTSTIEIRQTNNTKTKRIYDKRQYCLFCELPYSKISKHWSSKHADEPEVMEISAESDRTRKVCLITVLRNKGNHIHNCSVFKEGKGELVVIYRPKTSKGSNDYRPCEYCLGYYGKKELCRHRCKVEPMRKRGRVAFKSLMLLPAPDGVKPEVMAVLNGMVCGPVKNAIARDKLLQRLASKLFMRHGHEKKELVRAKLREMGRLIIEVQKFKRMENATLEDCLKPKRFKTVVRAVRALAGFDRERMTYKTPSLAINIGHTLRKCCQILKGQAIESSNYELIECARQFDDLCEVEWSDEVTFRARKELYERKRNSTKRLPLTADTKKLVDYLKNEIKLNKEDLMNADNAAVVNIWRHLAEVALVYLIIFNRRRQGEVSKIKLVDFHKARCGTNNSDIESCLSKMERQLCRMFYRVEIAGKRGRTVPLLMDTNMFETLSLLNRKRLQAGVLDDNPYVFALNKLGAMLNIRGSDCLRKFSVICGATYPETLRSTALRKHVATMSQLLSLKGNQLDMLAQFMGHDVRTHREFYRLPEDTLQLAKLSKLFLIMEQGNVKRFSGKNLDNVLLNMDPDSELEPDDDDEEEEDEAVDAQSNTEESYGTTQDKDHVAIKQTRGMSPDNKDSDDNDKAAVSRQPSNKGKKRLQRRWSEKEKETVLRHFRTDILRRKVPGKAAILHCLEKESCLGHRSWTNIRDYCRNSIALARHA